MPHAGISTQLCALPKPECHGYSGPRRRHRGPVLTVLFNETGSLLISGSYDKSIRLWNVQSGQELDRFTLHNGPVYALALSPDGRLLASASGDKTIRIREFAGRTSPVDTLNWQDYQKVFRAYLKWLPHRMTGANLNETIPSYYLTPLSGYRFPDAGELHRLKRPRTVGVDPIEHILQTAEN